MRFFVLMLVVLLNSCSSAIYQTQDIPTKPTSGYDRIALFGESYLSDSHIGYGTTPLSSRYVDLRYSWIAQSSSFKSEFPFFDVNLIAVNQYSDENSFSWEERLIFSDAVDLIVYVVNQPEFLSAMQTMESIQPFYNNEGTEVISAEYVVNSIRSSKLYFYLSKDSLDWNVMAQATVSGYNNTIWFRNDTDYATEGVVEIAEVLLHEMTHNLGWLHESKVPCGVQLPFRQAVNEISDDVIKKFINVTPFYEDDFLYRVRESSSYATISSEPVIIQKDYAHDLSR